jgi:2-amino-4-hydroxy-6-hydroxymethyldihydropteridine diphosphokinase
LPFAGRSPGESVALAARAISRLGRLTGVSRLYRSPAWPDPGDPPFVNAVASLETALRPAALLAALHGIEAGFGRRRMGPNAPRTLDLDLIDYDGAVAPGGEGAPALPHPRLADRDFVLLPLRDVAPDWRDPRDGAAIGTLLVRLAPWRAVPM